MKSTCSYFYVHVHTPIKSRVVYTHFRMKHRKASSTDDAICANDQVCPAGFVCGVGKQHASENIKKGSRTHSRMVA